MRWIEVHNIRPTPEGNVEMVVVATGKPLVLSMAQIKHRQGDLIWVENWLYDKLAPYLAPIVRKNDGSTPAGDGRVFSPSQSDIQGRRPPVS